MMALGEIAVAYVAEKYGTDLRDIDPARVAAVAGTRLELNLMRQAVPGGSYHDSANDCIKSAVGDMADDPGRPWLVQFGLIMTEGQFRKCMSAKRAAAERGGSLPELIIGHIESPADQVADDE